MSQGGLTAISPNGLITGLSTSVVKENGLLAFIHAEKTEMPVPSPNVYCEKVGNETFGFFVTGPDYLTFELDRWKPYCT
jgi:hypothetical protein